MPILSNKKFVKKFTNTFRIILGKKKLRSFQNEAGIQAEYSTR